MHFIGPDQLHGFEERLTTDIYPSDFIWTEQWGDRNDLSVTALDAFVHVGECSACRQLAYDDDAAFKAERKLYEFAMGCRKIASTNRSKSTKSRFSA
jgi:choline-sulfatase